MAHSQHRKREIFCTLMILDLLLEEDKEPKEKMKENRQA